MSFPRDSHCRNKLFAQPSVDPYVSSSVSLALHWQCENLCRCNTSSDFVFSSLAKAGCCKLYSESRGFQGSHRTTRHPLKRREQGWLHQCAQGFQHTNHDLCEDHLLELVCAFSTHFFNKRFHQIVLGAVSIVFRIFSGPVCVHLPSVVQSMTMVDLFGQVVCCESIASPLTVLELRRLSSRSLHEHLRVISSAPSAVTVAPLCFQLFAPATICVCRTLITSNDTVQSLLCQRWYFW